MRDRAWDWVRVLGVRQHRSAEAWRPPLLGGCAFKERVPPGSRRVVRDGLGRADLGPGLFGGLSRKRAAPHAMMIGGLCAWGAAASLCGGLETSATGVLSQ